MVGQVSVVTVVNGLWPGRTEVSSPGRAVIFPFPEMFEVALESTHIAFCSMGTGMV